MAWLSKLKKNFVVNMTWFKDQISLWVIFAGVSLVFAVFAVIASFLAGFWLNGLYGYKFDLSCCWQGVGAIASGVATLWTVAQAVIKKYEIDSTVNSKPGEMPSVPNEKE